MLGEINFNGFKTYKDIGFSIADIVIGFPAPITILEKIPFSNTYLDFSYMSGALEYSTRQITVTFKFDDYIYYTDKKNNAYFSLINALTTRDMQKLEISFLEGYFMARIANYSNFNLMNEEDLIQVTFNCLPFRFLENAVGNELWDTFNFTTDILQDTSFIVDKSKIVVLYNAGVALEDVTILTDSKFSINYNNNTYNVNEGTNNNVFKLRLGKNTLKIDGIGNIEFQFYKEVL